MVLKRAVILTIYYMPNGLTSLIRKNNPPNFQGCWGRWKNDRRKKNLKVDRSHKLEKGQDLVKQTVV